MAGNERVHRDRLTRMRADISSLLKNIKTITIRRKWEAHVKELDELLNVYFKEPEK